MKLPAVVLCWLGASAVAVASSGSSVPAYITAAVSDPARPAQQVEQDGWRQPAALMAFARLKPGDKVADYMSGNGYFTRLFSRVVGPRGRVYAFLPSQQLANCDPAETAGTQSLTRDPGYANVQVLISASDQFSISERLDMVWIAQDYHDFHDQFMAPTDVAKLNAALFRALKPGGVLLIIDHVAARASGLRDTETLHRIDPDSIREEVRKAGFIFDAQSEVLRNSEDSHILSVFDPAIRHRTDQVVLRFRKP